MASDSDSSSDAADGGTSDGSNASSDSSDSSSGDGSSGNGSGGHPDKNWLEWLVFGIGLALTLGVLGYLTYQVVAAADEPADVRIALELEAPSADGSTAIVPVEAKNEGDQVAEGVVIEVCAGPDSCGQLTIPYLPKGSTRSGSIGLSLPLEAPLTSRVVSYREP